MAFSDYTTSDSNVVNSYGTYSVVTSPANEDSATFTVTVGSFLFVVRNVGITPSMTTIFLTSKHACCLQPSGAIGFYIIAVT